MSDITRDKQIVEAFIFESSQMLEELEEIILNCEKNNGISSSINEIFRIMHTIKGSAAMMSFDNIASLAHIIEDLFYFLRENKINTIDNSNINDVIFEVIDFIKNEIIQIETSDKSTGDASNIIVKAKNILSNLQKNTSAKNISKTSYAKNSHLPLRLNSDSESTSLKNTFSATIFFKEGCEMENIRAFMIIHNLKNKVDQIQYFPEDVCENEDTAEIIRKEGFKILLSTNLNIEEIRNTLNETLFLEKIILESVNDISIETDEKINTKILDESENKAEEKIHNAILKQSAISVNINKLDGLMDLVGELVTAQSLVLQSPDLEGLELENFRKSSAQLSKITSELRDMVMSIRLVPLFGVFQKMNRIVRDMGKKLDKNVQLELIGAETEVDKNIIDHIADPLMHIIRNSIDHGIESVEERKSKQKREYATITLEAKNCGGEVWIIIKDDGRGLDKEKILQKAIQNEILNKSPELMTESEIYSLIFKPGFSTKEIITEFSGRGVGMDVVVKGIEKIRGSVFVNSTPNKGTTISIKIPLTLAIIDGMHIQVGKSSYIIPTTSIRESFKITKQNLLKDPNGSELIMVRGECFPIIRLHDIYNIHSNITELSQGMIIRIENEGKSVCIFADTLLGEQQVVIKSLPRYIKKINGISGCTLLGNGDISLILDAQNLVNYLS